MRSQLRTGLWLIAAWVVAPSSAEEYESAQSAAATNGAQCERAVTQRISEIDADLSEADYDEAVYQASLVKLTCEDYFLYLTDNTILVNPLDELELYNAEELEAALMQLEQTQPQAIMSTASLDSILNSLPKQADEEIGFWSQVWDWLEERFGVSESEPPEWLRNLELSDDALEVLLYIVLALLIIAAAAVVIHEVRLASANRRSKPQSAWSVDGIFSASENLELNAIHALPLREQPGYLLRYLLFRLSQRGWLQRHTSLSHRGIYQLAQQMKVPPGPETTQPLTAATDLAILATYGQQTPEPETMSRLIDETTQWLDQVETRKADTRPADE